MPETKPMVNPLVHAQPGNGEVVGVVGEGLRLLLTAGATNSQLILAEIDSPPGGGPPAIHTHPPMEAVYILEGSIEFSWMGPDGVETFVAGPGSAVFVPGGVAHNYKNVGETNARMLGIFNSASMENFFRDMARASTDEQGQPIIPPDVPKLMGVMAKYDVAFVGGPPGQS